MRNLGSIEANLIETNLMRFQKHLRLIELILKNLTDKKKKELKLIFFIEQY